ncbi:phenylalanine-tRNA ligase, putative [Babesia bigemina]|uniref:phenylalanine--tRNA ligase n=1 Tax=Babesia bigemina TaxID=5866 RepID=A0A061D8C4_BABBI|nr:phenylalanine-tRNA ligase, putative [Babesia bigemina]CDR93985.1 phenylalanine-tRNA ligase, putative [Babesia bigemina]|eukprot:XP_012766171.1 phenylalanine-tRNA ligase, putative [Babesia bigemina]
MIKHFFQAPNRHTPDSDDAFPYIAFDSVPVTIRDNFDELQVPLDHVSREPSENFYTSKEYVQGYARQRAELHPRILSQSRNAGYDRGMINRMADELGHSVHTVLPTHATSHLPDLLRRGLTRAIYSGQVFRRDSIDAKHYPVFHQLDGFRLFSRKDLEKLRRNAGIEGASLSDEQLIMYDLKCTLESLVKHMLRRVVSADMRPMASEARANSTGKTDAHDASPLQSTDFDNQVEANKANVAVDTKHADEYDLLRWDSDTSFPFTDPSLELYVKLENDYVEILGCGKLKNVIIRNILGSDRIAEDVGRSGCGSTDTSEIVGGWAFGIGLERLVMALSRITDIRQFWEEDDRFLRQYRDFHKHGTMPVFKPYSRNPAVIRDISFYVDGGDEIKKAFDECEFRGILEELSRDYVEDVTQLSEYVHPQTGRKSLCYRVTYRAMGENLTNAFVNEIHQRALNRIVDAFNIELR